MKKGTFFLIILFLSSSLPIILPQITYTNSFPILQIDSEMPECVGPVFVLSISAVADINDQGDGVTIMAYYDNIVPALSSPISAPYFLNEEITFVTNNVSSGDRLFSISCTDYLGNTVWENRTIKVDKTAPEIEWFVTNADRIESDEPLIFNWSVSDLEGNFECITITFDDGSDEKNSTFTTGFIYKYFNLQPFVFNHHVEYKFTVRDTAGNKAFRYGECDVYVPAEERPEYPETYVSKLNDTFGSLRNRDSWFTAIIFTVFFAITIPTTMLVVIKYKKNKNIPAEVS